MKILRIVYDWPPPWAGLGVHPYELTVAQAKKGHFIYVMSGRWPRQGAPEEPENTKLLHFMNNSSLPFRSPLYGLMLVTIAPIIFFRYLRFTNKTTIDLLHIHGSIGLWIYVHRKFLKKFFPNSPSLRIPVVAHFHNTIAGRWKKMEASHQKIRFISKWLDWKLALWADKLAVEIADALIFVGEEIRTEAIQYYGAAPSKTYLVESGVNTYYFKPVGPEEHEKTLRDLGIDPDDKVILNHGYMVERKNIHLLVECLKYLPSYYKLLLAGPFADEDYRLRVLKVIEENHVAKRVIMTGYAPYPQTPIAYQASNLFVLPSSFEGTPKVVMQSLACGVPALVSGFKLSEDIRGLVYITNNDPAALATQIKELLENPPIVDRSIILNKYSWEQRAKIIDAIYSKVIEGTPAYQVK